MSYGPTAADAERLLRELVRTVLGAAQSEQYRARLRQPPVGAAGAGEGFVVNDWLWVYRRKGPPAEWVCHCLLPAGPPFPLNMPCLRQLNGVALAKENVEDVLLLVILHLAHAAFHAEMGRLAGGPCAFAECGHAAAHHQE